MGEVERRREESQRPETRQVTCRSRRGLARLPDTLLPITGLSETLVYTVTRFTFSTKLVSRTSDPVGPGTRGTPVVPEEGNGTW